MIRVFIIPIIIGFFSVLYSQDSNSPSRSFPRLQGPYLGQALPGTKPQRFASSIFTVHDTPEYFFEIHSSMVFSPAADHLYFQKQRYDKTEKTYKKTNMVMKMKNGVWSEPEPVNFSGLGLNIIPIYSADGKRIFFSYRSPGKSDHKEGNKDIWLLEKTAAGWGKPRSMGGAVNTPMVEAVPDVARNGNLYFYRRCSPDKGLGEIFVSRYSNSVYLKAERLSDTINSPDYEAAPQVAPDESYLIFLRVNRAGITGQYISFKQANGSWTEARSMGPKINSGGLAFSLSFSPDRRFVFYLLRENQAIPFTGPPREPGIYWLKADFIAKLREQYLGR